MIIFEIDKKYLFYIYRNYVFWINEMGYVLRGWIIIYNVYGILFD